MSHRTILVIHRLVLSGYRPIQNVYRDVLVAHRAVIVFLKNKAVLKAPVFFCYMWGGGYKAVLPVYRPVLVVK